ncbi:hypothetical protein PoB_001219100 [Plakobranchus ocellatus]|uniref:Uncharacterized protein n=1 Tax=Plakobranchus ocellatus TaxID=259542 RepID=A0AAV3YEE3_9GAST|nr:hypothetical protein PoB_001219100 [Plakobranchus ocellatus]
MSREYVAVATVNNHTLAVGYWLDYGIDLKDLGGQVLCQICSSVAPLYMDRTVFGDLVCSTVKKNSQRSTGHWYSCFQQLRFAIIIISILLLYSL